MSSQSASFESMAKISWLFGCAHQLPLIGPPVIASAKRGAGPLAEASTTPCSRTNDLTSSAVMPGQVSSRSRLE
jgi:hypothetical protein